MTLNTQILLLILAVMANPILSQEDCAHVVDATGSEQPDGTWTISATVSSTETGWDKYADQWRVELLDGTVLKNRTLLHPHVEEQPFTRNLLGVEVPADVEVVIIAARDSVLGYCGDSFELRLRGTDAATVSPTDIAMDMMNSPSNNMSMLEMSANGTFVGNSSGGRSLLLTEPDSLEELIGVNSNTMEDESSGKAPLLICSSSSYWLAFMVVFASGSILF